MSKFVIRLDERMNADRATIYSIETPPKLSVLIVETVTRVRSFVRGYFCSPVTLVRGYKRA